MRRSKNAIPQVLGLHSLVVYKKKNVGDLRYHVGEHEKDLKCMRLPQNVGDLTGLSVVMNGSEGLPLSSKQL